MTIRALFLTIIASILADVVAKEWLGFVPTWLVIAKGLVLIAAAAYYFRTGNFQLARYSAVLTALVVFAHVAAFVGRTPLWEGLFNMHTFSGYFSSMVLMKFMSTVPLVGVLLLIFKSPQEVYLTKGDLSVKAEPIRWLGIKPDWITWRRLSVISGFAIAGGTLVLTLFTVTGFSLPETLRELPRHIPIIILLALVNSVSEGFMFRNAILGSLRHVLPKDHVLLIAAVLFGLAHFYGAPSGFVGVVMSGVLGWYLSRSMYETGGLVSSWIIHFLQDAVIFTMLLLLVTFI